MGWTFLSGFLTGLPAGAVLFVVVMAAFGWFAEHVLG